MEELNSKGNVLTEVNTNSPIKMIKSSSTNNCTPEDNRSPIQCSENKQSFNETQITSPRRNSVKRNLNKSFRDYSIIEPADENSLKLKLRKSRRTMGFQDSPSIRKSSRNIPRKSYAEYISPLKSRKTSLDEIVSPIQLGRNPRVVRKLDTPTKAVQNIVSIL